MHFDWELYESETGCVPVTSDNLPLHKAGLATRLYPRVLCEVKTSEDKPCQLAVVRLVCGPLVEVSLVTAEHQNKSEDSQETKAWSLSAGQWIDSEKCGIFKFGYCKNDGGEILEALAEDTYKWCHDVGLDKQFKPLDHSYPPGSGLSLVSHVRVGDRFELQSAGDPASFWRVTVTENLGGILGLGYDSQESVPNTDLHIHVMDPRLQQCGTVSSRPGATWTVPEQIQMMQ